MIRLACFILMLALAGPLALAPPAVAAPAAFNQALDDARRALDQKDPAGTLESLRRATALAWGELPFTALNVHLTAAPPSGYGQ